MFIKIYVLYFVQTPDMLQQFHGLKGFFMHLQIVLMNKRRKIFKAE